MKVCPECSEQVRDADASGAPTGWRLYPSRDAGELFVSNRGEGLASAASAGTSFPPTHRLPRRVASHRRVEARCVSCPLGVARRGSSPGLEGER